MPCIPSTVIIAGVLGFPACELQKGQSLTGKHIAGLKNIGSAADCCSECLKRSSPSHFCAAFTWHPSGEAEINCWLREARGSNVSNATCISGYRAAQPTPAPKPSPAPPPTPVPAPVPPFSVLNVRSCCGARGDGLSNDTAAIREAIGLVAAAGGGTVILPSPGTFVSAPRVLV